MDLIPIAPLSPITVMGKSLECYRRTFITTLPFVGMIIGLHFLIGVLPHALAIPAGNKFNILFMMGSILLLPLTGGFLYYQNNYLKGLLSLKIALFASFSQLIPMMLSFIYLAFIPFILITIGIVSFLFLDPEKIAFWIRFSILLSSIILTFLLLANKILAPIIIVLKKQDANSAQAFVIKLTKGYYLQTLLLGFLPILIGILLFWLPTLLNIFYPNTHPYGYLLFQSIGDIVLGIAGPYISILVLLHINDLVLRKKAELETEVQKKDKQYEGAALKSKPSDENML